MTSGRNEFQQLRITGDELAELKRHTPKMTEAPELSRKIENYKGRRPLTLYQWDRECLLDVIDKALANPAEYPDHSAPGYLALESLRERLRQEHDGVHGEEEAPAGKAKAAIGSEEKAAGKKAAKAPPIYQLKITLKGTKPPIWRRIQVEDCTLDDLHEYIQDVMGWDNAHLHMFQIGQEIYNGLSPMGDDFGDMGDGDTTETQLSDILPRTAGKFRFRYEYDFGDSWDHEILYEKKLEAEPGREYPVCVAGARACPPEDVGGVWGYADFVVAIQDRKHPRHKEVREWFDDDFDPEAFDPKEATAAMHGGTRD